MKTLTIHVCNRSTLVADADVKRMALACNKQLSADYQLAWGGEVRCKFVAGGADEMPNTIFVFDDPDTAGALGYHDETPGGQIYGKVFARIDGQAQDLFGPQGLSVTLSHEVLEMAGDPSINIWVAMPDGKRMTCRELCDAVEGDSYPVTVSGHQVYVSNFLWPEWFDGLVPAGTQCDQLDTTPGPFKFSSASVGQNYMIVMNMGTGEKQVFGRDAFGKEDYFDVASLPVRKQHAAARTVLRLAQAST